MSVPSPGVTSLAQAHPHAAAVCSSAVCPQLKQLLHQRATGVVAAQSSSSKTAAAGEHATPRDAAAVCWLGTAEMCLCK